MLNDNLSLEQLYQRNKEFFEALSIYIAAGSEDWKVTQTIPEAMQKAQESGDQMDVQVVNDLHPGPSWKERNHDLKLTRQMTIQQAPQIRLIQIRTKHWEKIQSSIDNDSVWKINLPLRWHCFVKKMPSQRNVKCLKRQNQLIQKNSEMLNFNGETARENERGIDLETLQRHNKTWLKH